VVVQGIHLCECLLFVSVVATLQLRPFILDVTDGCGETKGCYRNPAGCSEQTCDMVVTWKRRDSLSYDFAMSAPTDGWIALGLSEDKFMVRPLCFTYLSTLVGGV